jgi:2-haloacid dehalogenase
VKPHTLVFDLGNVLIGWEPRALYRKLFAGREAEMEWFLANVCTSEWNLEQDRGRSFAEGVAELIAAHPEEHHAAIRAFHERWPEMLTGPIEGTLALLEQLHRTGTPVYALTNWNQATFAHARERYAFLTLFRGIIVSGEERLIKPDPAIYRTLCERFGLAPEACVFVDDSMKNVEGARAAGMHAIHFTSPEELRAELRELGFPV